MVSEQIKEVHNMLKEIKAIESKYWTATCSSCNCATDPRIIDDKGLCPACGGSKKWKPEYKYRDND